jgi:hypothetical protein
LQSVIQKPTFKSYETIFSNYTQTHKQESTIFSVFMRGIRLILIA